MDVTRKLREERDRARLHRTILAMILAGAVLAIFVLLSQQRPPSCGVRLLGDGTWERADGGAQLIDGCELVVWEE